MALLSFLLSHLYKISNNERFFKSFIIQDSFGNQFPIEVACVNVNSKIITELN